MGKVFEKRHAALKEKREAEKDKPQKDMAPVQFADVEMMAGEGSPYHKAGEQFECSEAVAKVIENKGWATRVNGRSPKVKAKELAKEVAPETK